MRARVPVRLSRLGRRKPALVAAAVAAVAAAGVAVATVMVPGDSAVAGPGRAPRPDSIASAGDSITRGYNVTDPLADSPAHSWSTGDNPLVNSHYQRILAVNPKIRGHRYGYARGGAKMADLPGQLRQAARQRPGYLTVLVGANDLCAPTPAAMTPAAAFEARFTEALTDFTRAAPEAKILVSSIPDLYHLWRALHTDSTAQAVWGAYRLCPSMLTAGNTEADRQLVVARQAEYHRALERVCGRFAQCRWDGYATHRVKFSAADVSVDYFHPNATGQNRLAAATWAAGPWSAG
jgi:lysophospholipase L1-like esterase